MTKVLHFSLSVTTPWYMFSLLLVVLVVVIGNVERQ
jgi:hypothetical protein